MVDIPFKVFPKMQRKLKAVQGFLQQGVIFTVLALSHVLFLIWFKTAKSLNTELLTLKSSTYTEKNVHVWGQKFYTDVGILNPLQL